MNKRFGSFLILVLLFMFICFTHVEFVYADKPGKIEYKHKMLDVPLFAQQTEMWCWVASGEMIMAYFGEEVPQCLQANNRTGRYDCCKKNRPPDSCIKGGYPQYGKYGFNFLSKYGALSWQKMVDQIDANKPVGFSWVWSRKLSRIKGVSGHHMVARGYIFLKPGDLDAVKLVVVNDPGPPSENKFKGGSFKIMTYDYYDTFKPHHNHGYDQYDIAKKRPQGDL